ncbi:thiamine phosphate synthase [Paenibacillus wynnii]|uniref:thiamine phosphate synthase n=1 Tax=Paenibacillus wynnii TaxID=268407 RepID=UPI0027925EB9|nr:thiamine phosphate synthase [Paenibacillus wynnii]MDQ0191789.1 thiazole tautomerase (transcriptional regulator TenI) [Paenibacillus wynnii]
MVQAEIHLISDGKLPLSQFIEIAGATHPLLDYIHLREKHRSARELMAAAEELLRTGLPSAKLIINDRIDVALAVGARGVQLPWHSLTPVEARALAPHLRLGRSIHSPEEAEEANSQGADFCLFGHVFTSTSKPGQPERGLAQLAQTVRISRIPVIAIGGITPDHVSQIMKQGAAGIAVISGICGSEDPVSAVKAYRASLQVASKSGQVKEVSMHESAH